MTKTDKRIRRAKKMDCIFLRIIQDEVWCRFGWPALCNGDPRCSIYERRKGGAKV